MSELKVSKYPIFNHPRIDYQKARKSKEKKEEPCPSEFKYAFSRVSLGDIYKFSSTSLQDNNIELLPQEEKDSIWVNKLVKNKELQSQYQSMLVNTGFTEEESKSILDQAIHHTERVKSWSSQNASHGLIASHATSVNIVLGLFKELVDTESTPWFLNTALHLAYGATRSIRSYCQYSIYGRHDDDAAMNQYQADVYGNKIAGNLSRASVFTERFVNSWAYTALEALPTRIRDPAKKLLCLPTSMWWRARMPAHINQQYFTDLLSWMWHKPVAFLFGSKNSKKALKEIKEKDNISFSYFMNRHYSNAGIIKKKEKTFFGLLKRLFKLTRNTFSSDTETQRDSAKKLAETIAPTLGMFGFFSVFIGTIGGAVSKLTNVSNKAFDIINSASLASQQLIYLPKIVMPMYNETKELDEALKKENLERFSKADISNLKTFNRERRNFSYFGFTSLPLSVLNLTMKFFNFEDGFLNKVKNIVDDLSAAVSNKFFSYRRHLIGRQFRLENPEFY